jgi:peptidyl-prolyl cis-trans isomerase SDCCAG10
MLAMTNQGTPNTNQSQFFMTLDACPWLDRKHTIFGKVEGNSFYNLLNISELETDASDRPLADSMPTIVKALVLENPFDDIVPRNLSKREKFEENTDDATDNTKPVKIQPKT